MSTSILRGLKSIRQFDEEQERRAAQRERKVDWLTVGNKKQGTPNEIDIIFLQELDEGADRYSEKNGLGILVREHSNPSRELFFRRVLCNNDEEHDFQCWPCEKNKQEWDRSTDDNKYNGGWGVKTNLYINVLARYTDTNTGEEVEKVFVLQRKRSNQSFVDDLIDYAIDDGYITNRLFTLRRKGVGTQTAYSIKPAKGKAGEDAGINPEDYEVFDLDALIRQVDYEDQAQALGVSVEPEHVAVATNASEDSDPEDDSDDWL